jgi:hypothetical protein
MRQHLFLPVIAATAVLGLGFEKANATEITIIASHGSVSVTQSNHLVPVSASTRLTLPAQIKTGSDGTLDLKDDDSLVHIGPNSTVALPDSGPSGSLVDRYLQSAGSALYNIQSRHGRPMSVETPYLVSVVKGTVFTIAVEEGATSVTLMEGSLDVSAPGVREHVLLKPNQSIRHSRGENSLTVNPIGAAPPSMRGSSTTAALLTDEVNPADVDLVTRDLSEVGAAVSSQHAHLSASLTRGVGGVIPNAPPRDSSGGDISVPDTSGSGNSSPGGAPASNPTPPASGSSGSNDGTTVTTPPVVTPPVVTPPVVTPPVVTPPVVTPPVVTPAVGCNGKTNGTGQGQCLGHGKPKP